MKALVCQQHGHWSDLQLLDVPSEPLGDNEVRVAVEAAGMSFANILAIAGKHQNRSTPPFVPGTEAAGTIIEVGRSVTRLRPGDRVIASMRCGAFAQQAVIAEAGAHVIPESLSFAAATSLPTLYATAWTGLHALAGLSPDETVLVHGASGASGDAAVQIATALGARVIACASTDAKRRATQASGAQLSLPSDDFIDGALEATDGRGVDVVFDPVGGAAFAGSLRAIAPEGRLLTVGFASGDIPQIPANIVLVKNITVIGINWGYYAGWSPKPPTARAQGIVADAYDALYRLTRDGSIEPRVDQSLDFASYRTGFTAIENRTAIGKVVLTPNAGPHNIPSVPRSD